MLHFILGPSGSGKSYQMLAELRTRAERGERSILIVPEQFTSSTEGVLYRTLGDSLSAYVDSYSFTSLSEALLRRYGGAAVPTLTEAGRALLLRRAADSLLDKVVYYSRQRRSAAFCEKAAQTISELKSAGVTPEMLAEYAKTPGADREKLDELALIYNAYEGLLALPGIGEYTAGAIASISFGLPVPAVDGNVLRVFARLYNDPRLVTDPQVKREFTARVMEHQPPAKAGDYNQALMELGALVCLPNGAPLCEQCPLGTLCRARAAGTALSLPQKTPPKARRITPVTVALVLNEGRVLLQQRPAKGLLAGLWQPVLWEDTTLTAAETAARLAALGLDCTGVHFTPLPAAKHIFTHIEWHQSGYFLTVPEQPAPAGCVWAGKEQLEAAYTLPGAFKAYKKLLLTKLL